MSVDAPFFSQLEARVRAVDSLLCVGLDPGAADLADGGDSAGGPSAAAAEAFCLRIIAETRDVAAAFKPNAAFFEVRRLPFLDRAGELSTRRRRVRHHSRAPFRAGLWRRGRRSAGARDCRVRTGARDPRRQARRHCQHWRGVSRGVLTQHSLCAQAPRATALPLPSSL
jgi:hypothetical protein